MTGARAHGLRAGISRFAAMSGPLIPRRVRRLAEKIEFTRGGRSGHFAAAGFLGAAVVYGLVAGGHVARLSEGVLSAIGLGIETVTVTGNAETTQFAVLEKLELDPGASLPGFDAHAARLRVSQLPWVLDVTVRKTYPGILAVALTEKTPFALWQHDDTVTIIDRDGEIIVAFDDPRFSNLPLLVGAGANERATDFLHNLAAFASVSSRLRAAVFVAERRWNLVLDNGITVKLPESNPFAAVAELVTIDEREELLSRVISVVDLRLEDRVTVQPAPNADKDGETLKAVPMPQARLGART
jgi:cell division protein FtsQ